MIFRELRVKSIADSAIPDCRVDPLEKLSNGQREQLKPFQTSYPGTAEPYLYSGAADSVEGKTVVRAVNPSLTESAYWVVDLPTSEISPPDRLIMAPFGVARLTPSAKLLLIQQASIKPAGGAPAEMHLGPKFWLYNVATGNRVAEFNDEALAGSSLSNIWSICRAGKL